MWPPKGILTISYYSVPLLNTLILLRRGIRITWAHYSILENNFLNYILSILFTIILGNYFLILQYKEYCEASFSIIDGIFGRVFFMATGFHGIHVFLGILILSYTLYSSLKGYLTFSRHFLFEARAWYWHFVDVVWLFLYLNLYVLFS